MRNPTFALWHRKRDGGQVRVPNSVHESQPWRIREIVPDFTLEDVWALPARGDLQDFQGALEMMTSFDPAKSDSSVARALWVTRDRLGRWFGWGEVSPPADGETGDTDSELPIPGTSDHSLSARLPDDLRGTAAELRFAAAPFVSLYRTDVEYAGEVSNRTVHGVLHLAWVHQGDGTYQGQMAVYVKQRGLFGKAYMALIKPFRYLIVYPELMRRIERTWNEREPR